MKYLQKQNMGLGNTTSTITDHTKNSKYVPKLVPESTSTSSKKAAIERGPAESTVVHPDDEGSVHQVAPAEITSLTSKVSISLSTLEKTENGNRKLSLSNLLVKPRTK